QRTHFTTSRKPDMLKVFGETGGCPRGVYSLFASGFFSPRGSRGSSWYPRWRYLRSDISEGWIVQPFGHRLDAPPGGELRDGLAHGLPHPRDPVDRHTGTIAAVEGGHDVLF